MTTYFEKLPAQCLGCVKCFGYDVPKSRTTLPCGHSVCSHCYSEANSCDTVECPACHKTFPVDEVYWGYAGITKPRVPDKPEHLRRMTFKQSQRSLEQNSMPLVVCVECGENKHKRYRLPCGDSVCAKCLGKNLVSGKPFECASCQTQCIMRWKTDGNYVSGSIEICASKPKTKGKHNDSVSSPDSDLVLHQNGKENSESSNVPTAPAKSSKHENNILATKKEESLVGETDKEMEKSSDNTPPLHPRGISRRGGTTPADVSKTQVKNHNFPKASLGGGIAQTKCCICGGLWYQKNAIPLPCQHWICPGCFHEFKKENMIDCGECGTQYKEDELYSATDDCERPANTNERQEEAGVSHAPEITRGTTCAEISIRNELNQFIYTEDSNVTDSPEVCPTLPPPRGLQPTADSGQSKRLSKTLLDNTQLNLSSSCPAGLNKEVLSKTTHKTHSEQGLTQQTPIPLTEEGGESTGNSVYLRRKIKKCEEKRCKNDAMFKCLQCDKNGVFLCKSCTMDHKKYTSKHTILGITELKKLELEKASSIRERYQVYLQNFKEKFEELDMYEQYTDKVYEHASLMVESYLQKIRESLLADIKRYRAKQMQLKATTKRGYDKLCDNIHSYIRSIDQNIDNQLLLDYDTKTSKEIELEKNVEKSLRDPVVAPVAVKFLAPQAWKKTFRVVENYSKRDWDSYKAAKKTSLASTRNRETTQANLVQRSHSAMEKQRKRSPVKRSVTSASQDSRPQALQSRTGNTHGKPQNKFEPLTLPETTADDK